MSTLIATPFGWAKTATPRPGCDVSEARAAELIDLHAVGNDAARTLFAEKLVAAGYLPRARQDDPTPAVAAVPVAAPSDKKPRAPRKRKTTGQAGASPATPTCDDGPVTEARPSGEASAAPSSQPGREVCAPDPSGNTGSVPDRRSGGESEGSQTDSLAPATSTPSASPSAAIPAAPPCSEPLLPVGTVASLEAPATAPAIPPLFLPDPAETVRRFEASRADVCSGSCGDNACPEHDYRGKVGKAFLRSVAGRAAAGDPAAIADLAKPEGWIQEHIAASAGLTPAGWSTLDSDESAVRIRGSGSGEPKDPAGPAESAAPRGVVGATPTALEPWGLPCPYGEPTHKSRAECPVCRTINPATGEAYTFLDLLSEEVAALPAEAPAYSLALEDGQAERVIARVLALASEIGQIEAQAEGMVNERRRAQQGLEWRFGIALREWMAARLRGRSKSVKTLRGTVGTKTVKGQPKIADAAAVEKWALEQSDPEMFGRYGFALAPKAVLAYAAKTGEEIPGVTYTSDREDLYVKSDGAHVNLSMLRGAAVSLPSESESEEE